ncbi:MAG: hypothetical protein EOP55_19875 [Sphingobacteriales bacterium]|nr:MAG: hypothetical protein EOP55_19875 [Sphingobacteriales bacterium]
MSEKTESVQQLKTNDLSSLPVFKRMIWAHGQPDNLYISGDTLSMTDQYANYKYNKQNGTLIKMFGSAANDLGTFHVWYEFSTGTQYVKIVKRRDKNDNQINLYCYPERADFDFSDAYYPLDFQPHGTGVTGYVAIQKLDAQRKFVWAKLNGAYQINKNFNASVDVDDAGNIYICGTGPGATLGIPTNSSLGIIQKADNNGKLIWETKLTEQFPSDIIVDHAGNSYFIADNRVIKLDANGKLIAKKSVLTRPNMKSTTIRGLTIDKKNNLYITGRYQHTFPNGTTAWHSFIQKADVNGNFGWYISSSSTQTEKSDVNAFYIVNIIVDENGDIYAACNSYGTVTIGPGNKVTTDGDSPYVIKASQPGY